MAPRFSLLLLLFIPIFISSCFHVILAHIDEQQDPSIKTMEDFSGYPIHEPHFPTSKSSLSVDIENLQKQIDELSTFSDSPAPSVTRILYSEKDVLARRYVKNLMKLSGLSVREDAVGNIFGRWEGYEPELAAVLTGSHTDAIPYSGKYDGVIGVLGAIEAVNVLKRSGLKPKRSLEVIMFTSEEPTRFGISCLGRNSNFFDVNKSSATKGEVVFLNNMEKEKVGLSQFVPDIDSMEIIRSNHKDEIMSIFHGKSVIKDTLSRLLAGIESLSNALKKTVDNNNVSFLEAARSAGYAKDEEDLSSVFLKEGSYSAFVELHIEQGPILEDEGISIGHVTAIAAPASIKVDFEGNGGHAGAVLMPNRNDAGLAAAELALAVEKHVLDSKSIDTVGTVGILELHPGAINSIPSKSHLEIDTRDIDENRRNSVIEKIHQSAITISKRRGVKLLEFRIVNQDPPALSDESVIKAMESATQDLNLTYKKMISRAYHDSLFMARKSPMGMIFIPCYKGYSHKPEEFSSTEDIANGVKVLALTLAKLSLH